MHFWMVIPSFRPHHPRLVEASKALRCSRLAMLQRGLSKSGLSSQCSAVFARVACLPPDLTSFSRVSNCQSSISRGKTCRKLKDCVAWRGGRLTVPVYGFLLSLLSTRSSLSASMISRAVRPTHLARVSHRTCEVAAITISTRRNMARYASSPLCRATQGGDSRDVVGRSELCQALSSICICGNTHEATNTSTDACTKRICARMRLQIYIYMYLYRLHM